MQSLIWMFLAAILATQTAGQRIQTVEVGESRYFISNASPFSPTLNWFLAYEYCRNIGMELLSLERSEEASVLNAFLRENNYIANDYWTSGNQLGSVMWLWMSTGQPFNSSYNAWAAGGPPLTKSQQSCMSTKDATWSAYNCMDSKPFLCEQTRCFYYNYVTTNRAGSSQGRNTTIAPGVTIRNRFRPNPRNDVKEQILSNPEVPVTPAQNDETSTAPTTHKPTDSSDIVKQMTPSTLEFSKVMPTTELIKIMPTTEEIQTTTEELEIISTTEQEKIMSTTEQEKIMSTTEQVKIMPTTPLPMRKVMPTQQTTKVMPAVRPIIDDSNFDTENEIVPTVADLSLRLLVPPTNEFIPEEPKSDTTQETPNLMEILSRKETFSWALDDEA